MNINQKAVNALRILSADQVQKANSGHPGLPLGAAPIAYSLWANNMNHNPKNPNWENRDRFILSAGHGSSLLYSLLHMFGYGLSLEDLKSFRQFGSLTPGHPIQAYGRSRIYYRTPRCRCIYSSGYGNGRSTLGCKVQQGWISYS